MAEWNTQRLKRLIATNPQVIKEAATRDGTLREAQVFAAELARAVGPPPDLEANPAAESTLNLKVISDEGNELFFKCKSSTPLTKLIRAYCQRQGITEQSVRFIFDGERIPRPGMETPAECHMEDGDVIEVIVAQMGGCIASPVPALFGGHPFDSPGIAYLDGSAASGEATSAASTALIEQLGGSLTDAPQILCAPLLDAAACAGLIDYIDERAVASHGPSHDLSLPADIRLTASEAELTAVLGTSHLAALRTAFGGGSTFDTVKLRRVTGPLGCMPFHTDYAKRTLHVALNDDYEGGCVVFATANGFVQPARPTGSATLHVNCVVHGVTSLLRGARYSLFLCHTAEKGTDAIDALAYLVKPALAQFDFFAIALERLERTTDAELALALAQHAQCFYGATRWEAQEPHAKNRLLASHGMRASHGRSHHLLVELVRRAHMLRPAAYRQAAYRHEGHDAEALLDSSPRPADAFEDGAFEDGAVDAAGDAAGVGLIGAVRRMQSFMRRMLAVRTEYETHEAASVVLSEYVVFLSRVKHSPTPLVPTLAVDWLWHTHMLHPRRYATECMRVAGSFVDHDDDVGDGDGDEVEFMTGAA